MAAVRYHLDDDSRERLSAQEGSSAVDANIVAPFYLRHSPCSPTATNMTASDSEGISGSKN